MQGQLINELKIMYSICHNNIIGIYNHFEDDENCYLVIEYAGGGQVYGKMMELGGKRFPEPEAARMVYELCLALDYLHKRSIIHRDIKPENLLLSDNTHNATLKLADFGWSNFEENSKKRETYCGTVDYLAPEMADRQHKHDRSVDIWCVGVLIFELLTGRTPFSPEQKPMVSVAQAQHETKKNIITLNYSFPYDFPMFAKDLVKKIMVLDPAKRIQIPNMLNHPWFKQNNIGVSQISPSKDETDQRYNFKDDEEGFKSFVQNRIAESIMPGSNYKISGVETQDTSHENSNTLSPQGQNHKNISKMVNSTQYSFTPEELSEVIRPQIILGNKEITSKYYKPPTGAHKNVYNSNDTNGQSHKVTNNSSSYMNSSNAKSQNPYTQDMSGFLGGHGSSHRDSANRDRDIDNNNSSSKSHSKTKISTVATDPSDPAKDPKSSKAPSSKKELQKLLIVLKSKDEEIERLKLKLLQLQTVEKINQELNEENSKLQNEISEFSNKETEAIEKLAKYEAANVILFFNIQFFSQNINRRIFSQDLHQLKTF